MEPWATATDSAKCVVHVYPVREEEKYELRGNSCFCEPELERYEDYGLVLVHRRTDN